MYRLFISINTDDDAQIRYQGKTYCFYERNLKTCVTLETIEDCKKHIEFIQVGIIGKPGVIDWLRGFLKDVINSDNSETEFTHSSNQEIEIYITEI